MRKQAELWAAALGEPEKRAATIYQQVQSQFTKALGQALEQTAEAYAAAARRAGEAVARADGRWSSRS